MAHTAVRGPRTSRPTPSTPSVRALTRFPGEVPDEGSLLRWGYASYQESLEIAQLNIGRQNMTATFDAREFIARLGHALIREFEEARQATTGPLVGSAIERPVRKRLEQVLPRGIAVGSGCVIDSYGTCSRQQDVVFYERDVCPVFSINDTPESTYYPCEGVIAVMEVKSSIGSAELEDSFQKISSVKRLRRHFGQDEAVQHDSPSEPEYRRYQSTQMANIIRFTSPDDVEPSGLDQIFGAVLTERIKLKPENFRSKFVELLHSFGDAYSPNMVEVLSGGTLVPCTVEGESAQMQYSAKTATHFMYSESTPLSNLIHRIFITHRLGVTGPTATFDRYIVNDDPSYFGYITPKLASSTATQGGASL